MSNTKNRSFPTDIADKLTDLTEYVQHLGFALTSPKLELRVAATRLLSETINTLPGHFLSAAQLNFIATFYCDRLNDQHSVLPAVLPGILALITMDNLSDGIATRLLQSLFQNVVCQSQVRDDRLVVFRILQTLAERRTTEMLAMGTDFVYGVINAIDSERDPRLLVFIFDFLPAFLHTYPLGHLAEEMFEVCACYFPIDFNPSQSDPAAITRDVLADKLADCLSASTAFAEYCVPLLLEKLESELNVAKLDSLALLVKCAQRYDGKVIDQHFPAIWSSLKMELIPGANMDIVPMALHALRSIITAIASNATILANVMTTIFQTILNPLASVDTRFFASATNVAFGCARATKESADCVAKKLLPIFLAQLPENVARPIQRRTLLELMAELISICSAKQSVTSVDVAIVAAMEQEIVVCLADVDSVEFGVDISATISAAMTPHTRQLVYDAMVDRLRTGTSSNLEKSLKQFATMYGDEVMQAVIMQLINIDSTALTDDGIANIFAAICSVATVPTFTEVILTFLMRNIFAMAAQQRTPATPEQVQRLALTNLTKLIKSTLTDATVQELHSKYEFVEKSFRLASDNDSRADVLQQITEILQAIVKVLSDDEQAKIVIRFYARICVTKNVNDVFLMAGLIGHAGKIIAIENVYRIVGELIELSSDEQSDAIKVRISNELLCSLVNKYCDEQSPYDMVGKSIESLNWRIEAADKRALETLSWMTKGLLVSGHAEATTLVYRVKYVYLFYCPDY